MWGVLAMACVGHRTGCSYNRTPCPPCVQTQQRSSRRGNRSQAPADICLYVWCVQCLALMRAVHFVSLRFALLRHVSLRDVVLICVSQAVLARASGITDHTYKRPMAP